MSVQRHPIIFCGAGPGDPELITVKGQQALRTADLVLYAGSLVPQAVLRWTRTDARRINSAGMTLTHITDRLIQAFQKGLRAVRLHTGDPSLYGAIAEQMDALRSAGVPYVVVPGVTAAFAAAAAMGVEYTLPQVTQTLILTRVAGRTPVPEAEALEALARHGCSLVIYLSMALIDDVAASLIRALGPQARCAVAYKVSHPEEKIFFTRASELVEAVRSAGIDRHAVVIAGPAVARSDLETLVRSRLYDKDFSHGYRTR